MGMAVEVPGPEVCTSSALPAESMASQAPGLANAVPLAKPHAEDVPLVSLTSARLTGLYRELETSGRRDRKG
jgi:hypothetical protein